jgi:uncharacterized protein YukE
MFDAASRLAEGRTAVDTVQEHVWACHLLGYQDSDLTLHGSQVRDWYGSEDGIDLHALDADCDALRAAAAATEATLVRQDAQLAEMSAAWHGAGAEASREFLRRHGEASASVAAAVRTAAESLAALRDRLWRSIDGKVATTTAIGSRAERPDWLAAAQTVTTGAGDRATASELVDHEIKPFVDNDIRAAWLTAMRSAMAAVTNAYDAAAAEVTSEMGAAFAIPGDLGPSWSPSPGDGGGATTPAAASAVTPVGAAAPGGAHAPAGAAPTAWAAPLTAQPMPSTVSAPLAPPPSPAAPPLAPPPSPAAPPIESAAMTPPSVPSMGGAMPDIGSGLSGFGQQVGDMLGGLLGTSQDALSDLPEPDESSELDGPDDLDAMGEDDPGDVDEDPDPEDDENDGTEDDGTETDGTETDGTEIDPATDVVCDSAPEEPPAVGPPPAEPIAAAVEPAPTSIPVPPPPPPESLSAAGTPCEIAADELPQVGE